MKFHQIFLSALVGLLLQGPASAKADTITVFAAASLTDAVTDVAKIYETKSRDKVQLSFAATSTLAHQIDASGGADVFISADEDWMNYLVERHRIQKDTRHDLLANRLVMIAPENAKVHVEIKPNMDLVHLLHGGRLALAEPDSVPAGKYAREALTSLGVWKSVSDKLAAAENVRVALAYVARGEAPLGIVYETDAMLEPRVKVVGVFPANTHKPVIYPIALTTTANPAATKFVAFLKGPEATDIFRKAGFTVKNSRN